MHRFSLGLTSLCEADGIFLGFGIRFHLSASGTIARCNEGEWRSVSHGFCRCVVPITSERLRRQWIDAQDILRIDCHHLLGKS